MESAAKAIFTVLVVVTVLTYIFIKTDNITFYNKKENNMSALTAATQIAVNELIDKNNHNNIYEENRNSNDIPMDFVNSKNMLITEITRIIKNQKNRGMNNISNINIPLVGFVTYRYVTAITHDNIPMTPVGYTYQLQDGTILEFTLGEKVYIGDDVYNIDENNLNNEDGSIYRDLRVQVSSAGFDNLEQMSQYVVMERINQYINSYSNSKLNRIIQNTDMGVEYKLGKSKYSRKKGEYNFDKASVIEAPGMFCIIDYYEGSNEKNKQYKRIAAFGGSELDYREK